MARDARLDELEFLARVERDDGSTFSGPADSPLRQMVVSLLRAGYFNDVSHLAGGGNITGRGVQGADHELELREGRTKWQQISSILSGQPVPLRISHPGRVRMAELRQALRTGRGREPFGILWDRRHLEQDLAVALLDASSTAPVSVAFLDMNGMKEINDKTRSHAAGDDAIKTLLQVISSTVGDRGEGYRNSSGDEVIVVLPSTTADRASALMMRAMAQLKKEPVPLGVLPALTASCGIASADRPDAVAAEVIKAADSENYRAKPEAKKATPWDSAVAVAGGRIELV